MKKSVMFSALAVFVHVALAAGAQEVTGRILSLAELDVGGVKVQLAKTMGSDGRVCQDYVSSSVRADDGDVRLTISKICDKPATVASPAPFPADVYPAKLQSLLVVKTADGLAYQKPVLAP